MAAAEVETPVKMCLTVLEKKVRNLEKRKGKLESYQEKLTSGEELNKDQLEAIAKYNEVLQTLEFSRDLQKQFQSVSAEVDKMQRKQSKKEKTERQQSELLRLQEVLHLQTLLDLLGDDVVRERLKSVPGELVVTDDNLSELDEFYRLIAPSRDDKEFGQHVCSAAEHIQLYLDRSDRAVVGAATYCSLHELIDRLEMSNLLQTEVSSKNFDSSSSAKNTRQIADETQSESGPQQSSLVQQTSPKHNSQQSDVTSGITLPADSDASTPLFLAEPSVEATPWLSQSSVAVNQAPPVSAYESGSYYAAVVPSSSQLHHVEATSYAQQIARQSRPLQDIVSSLQGSFHFLQESQIEIENQSLLSSARNSNAPNYAFSVPSSTPVIGIEKYQTQLANSTVQNHSSSSHQFATPSSLYYQPNAAALFGVQQRASPDQHRGSAYLASDVGRQLVSSTDESCPMPIPLPNEVIHGQSLTMNAFNATQLSNSLVSKQFSMNPNANVFRSVYEPTSACVADSKSVVQAGSELNVRYEGASNVPHEHGTYGGIRDDEYSKGNCVNEGGGFSTQRSTGSTKNNARGNLSDDRTIDSSSTRGVVKGRRGSGFNQPGRIRQHMAV